MSPAPVAPCLTAAELAVRLNGPSAPTLLDVNDHAVYAAHHLRGARHANVFETSFANQVAKLELDPQAPLVVYGTGPGSHAARVAAAKLIALGYADVAEFRGGLEVAIEAGLPLDRDEGAVASLHKALRPDGRFRLDPTRSHLRWRGRNLMNFHEGLLVNLQGQADFSEGELRQASLEFDLNHLTCTDLQDPGLNAALLRHFRDPEFFNIDAHPRGRVTVERPYQIADAPLGSPNLIADVRLELGGQSHPLEARLTAGAVDAQTWVCQGTTEFDRTRWGVIYGSGKFFHWVGRHLVSDWVNVEVRLVYIQG